MKNNISTDTTPNYSIITELPGSPVIPIQLEREYHRYKFGASYCAGKRVLEIGCGGGQGLGLLAGMATEVVGGDCEEKNLAYARKTYEGRSNIRVLNFDAHQLPFKDRSFDVILVYEAIYYFQDITRFLSECKRVLDKGGRVIICTANKDWPDFNPSSYSVKYYSVPELNALFQTYGFACKFFGAFPDYPTSIKSVLRSFIKRSAVRFKMIPKSMKAKTPLKRLFFGKLIPLPAELTDGIADYAPPSIIPSDDADRIHSAIFAVATLNGEKENSKPCPVTDTATPLVSILMTVYMGNSAEEIRRSLESVLRQDYSAIEVIVVYDGQVKSCVREAVENFKAKCVFPLKDLSLHYNIGAGPALNTAIELSEGKYLAIMDADDYSHPDRIRLQTSFMEKNPEVDVLGCHVEEIFDDGTKNVPKMPITHNECASEFLRRNPINHPTAFFRRSFFKKAGKYRGDVPLDWDSALWLAGFRSGCIFSNLEEVKYKMYLDSHFFRRRKNLFTMVQVLRTRLKIVSELNYGAKGYLWAFLRFLIMFMPETILKKTYRSRNLLWARLTALK